MGIITSNHKLENGIMSDFYYKLNSYTATPDYISCSVSIWADFETRKNEPSKYVNENWHILLDETNIKSKRVEEITPAEMFNYIYECLTSLLKGQAELDFKEEPKKDDESSLEVEISKEV